MAYILGVLLIMVVGLLGMKASRTYNSEEAFVVQTCCLLLLALTWPITGIAACVLLAFYGVVRLVVSMFKRISDGRS